MTIVEYDGSLKGFLTTVFEVYQQKINDASIKKQEEKVYSLFGQVKKITPDTEKANRVWVKLAEKLSIPALRHFYYAFLSALPGMEDHLLGYIRYVLSARITVENNFAHPNIKAVVEAGRKVLQEKKQWQTFGKFQVTRDELYFLVIQPQYDCLPLLRKHFKDKYTHQRWLLADSVRGYGFYFNQQCFSECSWKLVSHPPEPDAVIGIYNTNDAVFRALTSSPAETIRSSQKLCISELPRNYWRHFDGSKSIHLSGLNDPSE